MRRSRFKAVVTCLMSIAWIATAMPASAQSELIEPTLKIAKPKKKAKRVTSQPASINDRINRGLVSIVALDDDAESVNDFARALNEEGQMRVVPILGESAVANVRDLLYLRGVDAGILNADILAYLRITGEMAAAQSRVRYVTKLYDKTVFLVVGPAVASAADLAGKKIATIGETSDSGVTARTIVSLAKIDAELVPTTMPKAVDGLLTGQLEGLIVVERDAASLLRFIPEGSGLKIVALPVTEELAKIYTFRRLAALEAPSLLPAEGVQTLTVPTLLAVYDWKQDNPRYPAVSDFVRKLIARTTDAASYDDGRVWRDLTPDFDVSGWQRFDAAASSIASTAAARQSLPRPAATAEVAVVTPPDAKQAAAVPAPVEASKTPTGLLRIVASRRQPLVDDSRPGGGIVTEILTSGLEADGAAGVQLTWSSDRQSELNGLIEGQSFDAGFAWAATDCDNTSDLSEQSAVLCDQFLFTEPIMQVLTVLFARSDSGITFAADTDMAGKSLCLPEGADEAELNRGGRGWLRQRTVTLVRAPTLADCFKMVSARDADVVMASEIEGRTALAVSGLAGEIEMLERPLASESLAAVVAKSHPRAAAVVERINAALAKVKANGGYYSLVDKHLVALWGAAPATR
jgi:fructose-specific component phosphotransferase system IIB-like protein